MSKSEKGKDDEELPNPKDAEEKRRDRQQFKGASQEVKK